MTRQLFLAFFFIAGLFVSAPTVKAQTMTDKQVYEFVVREMENGSTQQQIATRLMQRGVQIDQIRRVRSKYQRMQKGDVLGGRADDENAPRTRNANGQTRPVQPDRANRRRQEIYNQSTREPRRDFNNRQGEIYSRELDFMFPDSLDIYADFEMESKEPKIFGHDIFNNEKLTFESSLNIATPTNYVLGPGDEVYIDIYGESQRNIHATVSPEGTVDIEDFGPVHVGGLTVAQATARMRSTLGQRYADSKLRLTVGQTKTLSVQVMGAVNIPGTYTLSAFSTVFHALYMAGGVTDIGTLRNIKVFRNSKLISTVDVYDYILNGKLTGNVRLQDDDVIVVGTYECLVNVAGRVKRPMFYEMKPTESVETLLAYAGGFTGDAYQKTVSLVRKNGERYSMFTIDEFERPNFKVCDGDSVNVDSTIQRFENMVMLKGAVTRPGMYQLGDGTQTVRELMTKCQGLLPEAYGLHAVLQRTKEDRSLRTISLPLQAIIDGTAPDVPLQNEDVIYVMNTDLNKEELTMTIFGEVQYPGIYDFAENTTITDFIIQAGGLRDAASLMKIDVSRRIRDNKALTSSEVVAKTFSFSIENGLIIEGDTAFHLEPFDEVYVRSSPGYIEQQHVTVSGEVAFAGEYTLARKGLRLSDIVKECGGITHEGYAKGARLERRMTEDEKSRRKVLLRIAMGNDSVDLSKLELSDTRSVGIDLEKAIANPGNDEWDIVLEEGDRLIVPQYRNTVSINGEVMFPTTVSYKKGAKLSYYINNGGGYSQNAKTSRIFAVNMNGTVTKVRSAKDIMPGSEIVVPSKRHKQRMSLSEVLSLGTMTASVAAIITSILK